MPKLSVTTRLEFVIDKHAATSFVTSFINCLTKTAIDAYIQEQAQVISKEYREHFIKTINEDLIEINLHRIAGLGMTAQQLKTWLSRR